MSIMPVYQLGQSVLREEAKPVEKVDDEVRKLIADMFETMDAALGVGLAGNQVGVTRRIAVIDTNEHRFAMINPRITSRSGKEVGEEGCLSIPDITCDVPRAASITLEALDEHGDEFTLELSELSARAVLHEIDHLDGVLIVDYLPMLKKQFAIKRWKKEHRDLGATWTPEPEESEAGT